MINPNSPSDKTPRKNTRKTGKKEVKKKKLEKRRKTNTQGLHNPVKTKKQEVAQRISSAMGLSNQELQKYYSGLFWNTLDQNIALASANPESARDGVFDFYASSRPYGGATGFLATGAANGDWTFLIDPESFQEDLRYALKNLYQNGDSIKALDLGCGSGLTTLSLASIIEDENQGKPNRTYSVQGFDIDAQSIGKAQRGKYSQREIYNGHHRSNDAIETELANKVNFESQLYQAALKEGMSHQEAKKLATSPAKEAQELINRMVGDYLIPFTLDSDGEGFKVKKSLLDENKLSFQTIKPFDLSSVDDGSLNLVSMFSMFNMLSDEGIARIFKEAIRKLKPGGYIFSDIAHLLLQQDNQRKYPKTIEVLGQLEFVTRDPPVPSKHQFFTALCRKI